jgi:20S proteasome alpha/beta subunit
MTLAIGIIANDGVALASDSRATIGDPRGPTMANDTVQKVFKITDFCGLAIAGEGGFAISIFDVFLQSLKQKPDYNNLSIDEIVDLLRNTSITKYNEWFPHLKPQERPFIAMVVCGYRNSAGVRLDTPLIFSLLSIMHFAPSTDTMGFAAGGIIPLATYLLNRLYTKNDINLKAAVELAAFCIRETASQDGKVGGELQLATFSKDKPFMVYNEKDIEIVKKRCEEFRKHLRNPFYAKEEPKGEIGPAASVNKPEEKTYI